MKPERTIQHAELMDIGYAYLRHAGLPFLAWPLLTMPVDYPAWFRAIAASVGRAPVCQRTEADVWRDLGRLDNARLRRLLHQMDQAA